MGRPVLPEPDPGPGRVHGGRGEVGLLARGAVPAAPRAEAFYDARSEFSDLPAPAGGGRPPPPPPGNLGVFSALYDQGDAPGRAPFYGPDAEHAGGHWGDLPPPPPGGLGVFSALYSQRPGNQTIQSGFVAPFPVGPPVQISHYPQLTRNYLEQEGVGLPPEPVQPSFFQHFDVRLYLWYLGYL